MLPEITPYIFFTGKGGVGKTSLASTTAIKLADEGKSVLLISTDPASNLKEVLETNVTEKITPIEGVENLHAVNIDPELSAEEYRNRVTSPMEGILPEGEINKIREELSGACTTEIAAFDEFARYVAGDGKISLTMSSCLIRPQQDTHYACWNCRQPGVNLSSLIPMELPASAHLPH